MTSRLQKKKKNLQSSNVKYLIFVEEIILACLSFSVSGNTESTEFCFVSIYLLFFSLPGGVDGVTDGDNIAGSSHIQVWSREGDEAWVSDSMLVPTNNSYFISRTILAFSGK